MRYALLLALIAACAGDDGNSGFGRCPTVTGEAYSCSIDWQLGSGAGCEVACAVPPAYTNTPCNACRGFGGDHVCDQTFEFNGQRGCCVIDDTGLIVRFFGCD